MQRDIQILKADYNKWLSVQPKKRAQVPAPLRESIVAFVKDGRRAEVCRVLGISSSTISNWKASKLKDKVLSKMHKTEKIPAAAFSYSRADIPLSGAASQRGLAELEMTLSGQKMNLRFHDKDCLEKILKTLLKGGTES